MIPLGFPFYALSLMILYFIGYSFYFCEDCGELIFESSFGRWGLFSAHPRFLEDHIYYVLVSVAALTSSAQAHLWRLARNTKIYLSRGLRINLLLGGLVALQISAILFFSSLHSDTVGLNLAIVFSQTPEIFLWQVVLPLLGLTLLDRWHFIPNSTRAKLRRRR